MSDKKNLSAARNAFDLVDEAITKAETAIKALKHTRVPDTTVMLHVTTYSWTERYKCSNCEYQCGKESVGWKFCPSCGAEIMRWEKSPDAQENTITVLVQQT